MRRGGNAGTAAGPTKCGLRSGGVIGPGGDELFHRVLPGRAFVFTAR